MRLRREPKTESQPVKANRLLTRLEKHGVLATDAEVAAFALAMQRELEKPNNLEKGPWTAIHERAHLMEIVYHAGKLARALDALDDARAEARVPDSEAVKLAEGAVLEFAADIGNHAMMLADSADVLDAEQIREDHSSDHYY